MLQPEVRAETKDGWQMANEDGREGKERRKSEIQENKMHPRLQQQKEGQEQQQQQCLGHE